MCNALPAPRCSADGMKNWQESKARLDLAKQQYEDLPSPVTEKELNKQQASFDWRDRQFSVVAVGLERTARIHLKQEEAGTITLTDKERSRYQAAVDRADNLKQDPEVWEEVQRERILRKTIEAYRVKGAAAFKGNARLIKDTFTLWKNLPDQEAKYRINQLSPEQQKLMDKAMKGDLSKDYLDRDKKKVNVSGDPREDKKYTVKTPTWAESTAALSQDYKPAPLPPRPGARPSTPTQEPKYKPRFGDLRTRS